MKIIGGPMHGKEIDVRSRWVIIPIIPTENHPKGQKGLFRSIRYERRKTPSGKEYLQFVEGYYEC